MKYKEFDTYVTEPGEPALRSCWECNSAHKHLKNPDSTFLHFCFACGRYWVCGEYLDGFESDEELDAFLSEKLKHVKVEATP